MPATGGMYVSGWATEAPHPPRLRGAPEERAKERIARNAVAQSADARRVSHAADIELHARQRQRRRFSEIELRGVLNSKSHLHNRASRLGDHFRGRRFFVAVRCCIVAIAIAVAVAVVAAAIVVLVVGALVCAIAITASGAAAAAAARLLLARTRCRRRTAHRSTR